MDLKRPDDILYLVGEHVPRLGASHYRLVAKPIEDFDGEVPPLSALTPTVYRALHRAINARLVKACHDLSEGGLGVAAAEMCIGGRLGMQLDLGEDFGGGVPLCSLYGETNGCLLVEVSPEDSRAFEAQFEGLPLQRVGWVRSDRWFYVRHQGRTLLDLPVDALVQAWIQEG